MSPRRVGTLSNNQGQAALEFLFTSIFLLLTIFAAVQLSVLVYTYSVLAEGAKQGVRYAIVHGSTSSPVGTVTDIENVVKKYADYPGMSITVTGAGGAPSSVVQVTVNYQFSMLSLGWALPMVHASARGRIFH